MMPELKLRRPIEKGKELWVGWTGCGTNSGIVIPGRTCPGFIDGTADFERPIVPRCLEMQRRILCGWVRRQRRMSTEKAGMCWGFVREVPWGDESTWKGSRRDDKAETSPHRLKSGCGANTYGTPSRIVNPAGLSWERQVEVCAPCHGGIGESVGAFS